MESQRAREIARGVRESQRGVEMNNDEMGNAITQQAAVME